MEDARKAKEDVAADNSLAIAPPPTTPTTSATSERSGNGLNVSYKVETRDIPKLPPYKSLKGKIFDNWHSYFYVKMCQAKLGDMLAEGYT
eukprot:676750-Ditylum_brightwellii.AAC.1